MTVWNIHFLNARQPLNRVMPEIRLAARAAVAAAGEHVALPHFDLTVRAGPEVVPGWGVGGYAPHPGHIQLTVDPARFDRDKLIRTLVHELHHLIRWDGPGYGRTLGEALVSEGLAGHFVLQVMGGDTDPWDSVAPSDGLARRAMNEWARLGYDHAEWFFGAGNIRRWSGYGLGHRLIAAWLADHPHEDAVTLATVPAERFRNAMRRLANAGDGAAPQPAPVTRKSDAGTARETGADRSKTPDGAKDATDKAPGAGKAAAGGDNRGDAGTARETGADRSKTPDGAKGATDKAPGAGKAAAGRDSRGDAGAARETGADTGKTPDGAKDATDKAPGAGKAAAGRDNRGDAGTARETGADTGKTPDGAKGAADKAPGAGKAAAGRDNRGDAKTGGGPA
ncbi:MAG: DUF2268 domain-containing putative Zn-dependent protease [Paracoccus sp. (in: a-proteobacteria)]|nr:DUF2268 domain-containing putative Zn-dependent protease [Paracoccus sp. (in: a-proteobacteria)]